MKVAGDAYPVAGIMLGPALAFGYIAGPTIADADAADAPA
jgi:hypothetical protein